MLRAFEERRRSGAGGYFFSDSLLRTSENRSAGDLIASHVPGVSVERRGRQMSIVSARPGGLKSKCYPDVYLDGVPVAHDLSDTSISTLAGVEFYGSGAVMPIQFNRTASGCGALLLWTR